jgi:hypothetical protein
MLAAAAATPVEVRLMKPPPLEQPLSIREDADGSRSCLTSACVRRAMSASSGAASIRATGPRHTGRR